VFRRLVRRVGEVFGGRGRLWAMWGRECRFVLVLSVGSAVAARRAGRYFLYKVRWGGPFEVWPVRWEGARSHVWSG